MGKQRSYDVVVFGATGFTGGLVADYLAEVSRHEKFTWALAGRNPDKLEAVRDRVAAVAGATVPALLRADINAPASMTELAASATTVITTVGPYVRYGEPILRACAEAGTHYVDLTGEPQFVQAMREKYDTLAKATGARIVNSCGFESIPPDMAVFYAVQELKNRLGERVFADADVEVRGGVEAGGTFSGGTWHSAIEAMATARQWMRHRPRPPRDNVHAVKTPLYKDAHFDRWACNMPTIDPEVVRHTARVRGDYGRTFAYGHFLMMKNPVALAGLLAGIGGIFTLAQFGPTRNLLLKVRDPGEGPSAAQREKGWFHMNVVAQAAGTTVLCRLAGGDPGYGDTSKMMAEAALCLALDKKLPDAAGLITPASAMGAALIPRLERAGLVFSVLG
ncbi:MAG: saccharopine dehydrogenase NADP-binding domain-containing protein [Moraxellaceae bacterium]|nr:saccharopine dehydrogenase NADP-binding domain-containing protein [Moraxellaceae bacterium]